MATGKGGQIRWIVLGVLVVLLVLAGVAVYQILGAVDMPQTKIGHASSMLSSRLGWSNSLVKGLVILASIPYFVAWSRLYPDPKKAAWNLAMPSFDPFFLFRDRWGLIIVAYTGCFYIVLSWASKDAMAYKNCADTPDGVYASDNTGIDPKYGRQLAPCTPRQINALLHPSGPKRLTVEQVKQKGFFDISGYPTLWYTKDEDGTIWLYDRAGTDAQGDQLQEVSRPIAAEWSRQQRHAQQQQQAVHDEQQRSATIAADSENAQQQYARGAFEQAIASCKPVLAANADDESCRQVQHDASTKLAQQLADRGQLELQHGDLVDASSDANHALKLDPANGSARNVEVMAQRLTTQSGR